ncbi:MAG: NRDE family protein [Alphaproteobacteria bacterium]|nr:NRDE family protein [Alphaproteobacteria bacterium]
MCTVVILRRPGSPWPLILGANRDENVTRPWLPPGRHWPDRPDVVAGLDQLAGGTWLGLNDSGVLAAVMNREGTLGPDPERRSRGELVLEALDHPDADLAAASLRHLQSQAYRAFNLIIADNRDAYWLKSTGEGEIAVTPIEPGLSMLTARDLNDTSSARIAAHLPRFAAAEAPEPWAEEWGEWETLMAAGPPEGTDSPRAAMAIAPLGGYGTVSGSLIALPLDMAENRPIWRFCAGPPGTARYALVNA